MKNLFTNLMKNTAKRTQNTGGGASHEKNSAVTVWNDSRTTVNRRLTDGQSQRQYSLGMMKYAAMITLLLTLACGEMWGDDYTETYSNPTGTNPPARANGMGAFTTITPDGNKVTFGNSSLQIGTASASGTFTISSTDGSYITGITFTQNGSYPVGTLTSSDGTVTGPSTNVYTFTPSTSTKTSCSFSMTASASKTRIPTIVVSLSSNYEYFSKDFSISSGTVSCTKSNGSSDITITSTGGTSNNGLTLANTKALTIASSGHNIKAIHFTCESHNTMSNLSANTGTYSSNSWTKEASTNSVTFTSSGSNATIVGISVELEAGCTSISPSLSYTSTSLMVGDDSSSPTLTGNTGSGTVTWTSSDDDVATVNESTGVVTAVGAGTATITASIAANGGYCDGSATANFTITRDPVGEDHVLTWPITTVSGSSESDVSGGTTDIGTGDATSTSTYITNQTDLTGVGIKRTTTGKNSNTGKIETPTSYDAAKYVSFTFDVEDGYQFTPTEVSIKTVAVSTAKDLKFEFSDANGSYSVTKTNLSTNATAATNTLDFSECDVDFTGTVTVKIYVYGANDAYRLSTPLTITGTVAAAASPLATTNPSSASYVKGASATALSVTASGGTTPYSYQWYSCDDDEKTNAASILGATSSSYTPSNTATGYYYCTVTDAASSSVSSSVATITVRNAYAPTASPAAGAVASGTAITLSSSDGGTIYYTTNGDTPDDKSTEYDSEDKPTITTATTIKAVAKVNGYLGSVLTAAYTIKPTPGLAYGTSTVNKTNGDANFTNSLTNPNSVSVSYSSSNTDVATVDSDGEVTIKKYGSATITASFAENATYLAQEVSYTLNVAKRTYTVTYNAGTGTITGSHSNDTKTEDETLTLPGVTFTQSGYVQTGWATEDGGSKVYDLEDSYTDNAALNLYPVWSEVYAVEEGSISNGSITISPTSAIAGATISLTASASLGYVFDSWTITKTSDESNVTASVSLSGTTSATFTMPAYGVTVTAAFEEVTYTLSYNNGGASSGSVPSSPAAGSYAAGTEITVPDNSGPLEKTGYTFRGWTDGTTFYLAGQKFNITGNTTLTAVWDGGLSCTEYEVLLSSATQEASTAPKGQYITGKGKIMRKSDGSDKTDLTVADAACHSSTKYFTTGGGVIGLQTYNAINKVTIYGIPTGNRTLSSIKTGLATNSYGSDIKGSCTIKMNGSAWTGSETWARDVCGTLEITFPNTLAANTFIEVTLGGNANIYGALFENCTKSNFTVSFDMKSHGSAQDSYVGVPTGKKIVAPAAPTATGYTFGGWYTDSSCTSAWNWESSTVTKDTTLYAKWTANSYTINYYDEGGSAFSGSHADGYPTTHTYGTGTDLKSATKSCYTFGGWYTASDCSTGLVTSLGATDYTAAINLYAKWTVSMAVTAEPEDVAATVGVASDISLTATGVSTYQWQVCDDDEGTNATDITGLDTEYEDYDEATLSLTPASEGTYYLRCKITDACSNVKYSDVATVTATEAYDITMGTHTNGSFTIQVGSADAVSESTESGAGVSITIAATPSSGYAFKEWEILDAEEEDVTATVGATATSASTKFTMPSEAVTINAVFVATHTLTVSVSGGVGGTVSPTSTTVGETLTQSISATPGTGYNFTSWAVSGTGASLSSTTANPTTFTMGMANATVTATFSAKTYSIELNAGNGTGGSGSVTMTYNSSSHTAITAPTLTGYSLVGWYTGAGGTGTMIMNASGVLQASVDGYTGAGGIWTKDATCTLYAKWAANYPEGYLYITDVMATPEAKAGYTITMTKNSANYNGTLGSTLQTNRAGYEYWADATGSSGNITLSFSDALPASATAGGLIIDVWWGADSNNRTTSIALNGGSAELLDAANTSTGDRDIVKKATYATELKSLSSITLSCSGGHTVWFRIGIKDRPGYLLTYDDGDGSGAPSASYQPNATITLSETVPTYAGHGFVGWQVNGSGTVYAAGDEFYMPAEATRLVAKWCTSISPSLSYSKTTLWVEDDNTATATLTGYYGTPTISYVSSDPTVVRVDNASTGAITALKRGTATITATIGATTVSTTDYCGNTVTCDITVKEMSCEHIEIASAILTSSTTATPVGGTALIKGLNGTGPYKLNDKPSHFGIKLNSNFQVGDSIIFKLKVGDWWSGATATSLPVVVFAGENLEKEIYRTTSLTAGTDNTYVRFAVTQEMIDDYSLTDEVIIYRTKTNDASCTECCTQNHQLYWVKVKRNACADVYYFNDESTSGAWSDEENWLGPAGQGGGLPTIDDRVVINKPMTVDVDDAQAAEIILDQSSSNTGKLTIGAGQALVVAGTIKTYDGSSYSATTPSDIVLESDGTNGTGALITGEASDNTQAAVQFYSKARYVSGYVNQFIGVPLSSMTAYNGFYGTSLRVYDDTNDKWQVLGNNAAMYPFTAYNLMRKETSAGTLYMEGALNLPGMEGKQELTITRRTSEVGSSRSDHLFANSWTAPIDIASMDEDDFDGADATIYIFNAGTTSDYATNGSNYTTKQTTNPGQWLYMPVEAVKETPSDFSLTVIPSMQAFMVHCAADNLSEAGGTTHTLTLDYKKHVYDPAKTSGAAIVANRAPRREASEAKHEIIRVRVEGTSGYADDLLLFIGNDFSNGYDNGWEAYKVSGKAYTPQLYAVTEDGKKAISAQPDADNTVIGFKAGTEDDVYTFTLDYEGSDASLYLHDTYTDDYVRVEKDATYTFLTTDNTDHPRFVLTRFNAPQVTTGVDDVQWNGSKARKLMIDGILYIIRDGRIYNAEGALVK